MIYKKAKPIFHLITQTTSDVVRMSHRLSRVTDFCGAIQLAKFLKWLFIKLLSIFCSLGINNCRDTCITVHFDSHDINTSVLTAKLPSPCYRLCRVLRPPMGRELPSIYIWIHNLWPRLISLTRLEFVHTSAWLPCEISLQLLLM